MTGWRCTVRWFEWRRKVGANAIHRVGMLRRQEATRWVVTCWRQLVLSSSSANSLASSLRLREKHKLALGCLRRWKEQIYLCLRMSSIMGVLRNGYASKLRIR
eukprot:762089-Hanusia_phi.AAC.2